MHFQNENEQAFWQQCVLQCLNRVDTTGEAVAIADELLSQMRERYKPIPAYTGRADSKIEKVKYLRQVFPDRLTVATAKYTLDFYDYDLNRTIQAVQRGDIKREE